MRNKGSGGNLDSESSEIKGCIRDLKKVDFELAYLAMLSRDGLKPLSRWEKPLGDDGLELLRQTGLLVKQIRRTVETGSDVVETVFSLSPAYIQLYEQHFGNRPIDKSVQTQRFEGFLFGYPPCCIDRYVSRPYAPNKLAGPEQRILFHWACRNCKITPILLHAYKGVYDFINNS
jgi:hypothetical protein